LHNAHIITAVNDQSRFGGRRSNRVYNFENRPMVELYPVRRFCG